MNRREFLQNLGIGALATYLGVKEAIKYSKDKDLEWMFGNIDKYIYTAKHDFEYTIPTSGDTINKNSVKGVGIVVDNKYITPDHVGTMRHLNMRTPFGNMPIAIDLKGEKHSIDDMTLERIVSSEEPDVSAYKYDGYLKEFPFERNYDVKRGDTIYVLGNPQLSGFNIRKGIVSDNDDWEELTDGCFGISCGLIPGDSGSPVINGNLELIGIANFSAYGLGYCTKIECFDEIIKNRNFHRKDKLR